MSHRADVNRVVDERPDFALISAVPAALPYWRLRLRLEVLAARRISPLELFVLRASRDADPQVREIQALLGLDDRTFRGVVSAVLAYGWAVIKPGDVLSLTANGLEALVTEVRERSESRVVSVEYDGLLRRPVLLDLPIEPQQRRSLGLREIPAMPAVAPDVVELQDALGELQKIVRRSGDGRDQAVELLAIKGVLRRERVYRETTLLIMRSRSGEIQAAPLIEGTVSDPHERALAAPALRRLLRIPTELRRGRQRNYLLPEPLRGFFDAEADEEAYALRREARLAHSKSGDSDPTLVEKAQYATRSLRIRTVPPHEQLGVLRTALRSAVQRVVIATPVIAATVVDQDLVADLERCLSRGVAISIAHDSDAIPPQTLLRLSEAHGGLHISRTQGLGRAILVRDDTLALVTLFPLLADRGIERKFRDERGWLVQRPENVRFILNELAASRERTLD